MCKREDFPCVDCGTPATGNAGTDALCDSCGEKRNESDAARIMRLALEDHDYLNSIETPLFLAGLDSLLTVMHAVVAANALDGAFPGSVCTAITRWRKERAKGVK